MLVALVVAMWDAKSRRPGGCVKPQHPGPGMGAGCPLHSRINCVERPFSAFRPDRGTCRRHQ
jgi:hypothetical protein